MQTVPSLVGTGTAIAAAASGLVFGEALDSDDFFVPRPASHSTARPETSDTRSYHRTSYPNTSRPGTSSAAPSIRVDGPQHHTIPHPPVVSRPPLSRYQRPRTSQLGSARLPSRRRSVTRQGEVQVSTIAETPRTSFSSSNSWIRRLSIRPSSQHDSPRSSVGPDSTSIAFSHGSGAPILSPTHPAAPPPTPNKLVKRTPSTSDESAARPRSKSHLPTLRRPATSHQRSATLQLQTSVDFGTPAASSNNSIDQPPPQGLLPSPFEKSSVPAKRSGWASFFHSRASNTGVRTVGRIADLNQARSKRISIFGQDHRQRAQLIKPTMVSDATEPAADVSVPADIKEEQAEEAHPPTENTPRRTRRSISMTFATAGDWVSRTSGSIRRPKRASTPKSGHPRHVSDPVTTPGSVAERRTNATPRVATAPNPHATPQGSAPASTTNSQSQAQTQSRRRNTSSPVPPLSGFSSFHADFSRSGSSGGAAIQNLRQNQPSGSSTSSTAMSQLRVRRHERTSTMDGSESEQRDFTSGDDEDTDFKSDTMFDSLRTGASGHVRSVETPLESMYDESPPSTAGNGKAKRLSIQEILGKDWEAGGKILEEDENMQTSVRSSSKRLQEPRMSTESGFSNKEYGRFSIDEDFDEDWTRDDGAPYNALSPPSKGSSLNSRGVHPNVRQALASVSGNSLADTDTRTERPLSNLFDWSEPSLPEKNETNGRSLRPKTAYANQEADARGGRSAIRKGPTPTHVRSQSVPVVHENQEEAKTTGSKYGTWGLGTKTISEDWDDDFEFGGGVEDEKSNENRFAVPESIQAAQPSVKAHSGQIRELSLLVNDLQRLCRHGKIYDLLDGPHRTLWKEAEGIIALASPDDDDLEADHETSSSIDLDAFEANDRLFDDDYDSASMDKLDAALDGHEPAMSKTAVVRDRPSPRRRSVMSPDDDIFGNNWPLTEENLQSRSSRPRTPELRLNKATDVNGMVRSVVEVMQQRSISDSLLEGGHANRKMHFDTNSLKILVKRAGDLRDILSDVIRRAEQITQSPARTPRHERQLESSPAFTKVFDDPGSSPPRRINRSRGNTTKVDSPENSPSSGMNRRMQLMTVK